FDSAPGGDALARRLHLPTSETQIDGPRELVQRLGVFHASFVTNLLFHRETALPLLPPEFLRSRYPHVLLSLALLRSAPAVFLPLKIVRAHMPPDTGEQ